ncbi:MarR family transcriptional regulator [Microbacterium pseudoresistens]|uniref:DNA-binding MarR family transcriptional regulator n=1 Tax=Microbacterium pseudoresistens TaxID=640634 RepID=A0A7Y9JM62_9MICO|nr:MarR family transcriptional regulator [Microbacterium pseudoresistens]NYD54442.1 DNA-binding MarR family transcriptional regulator [Microbacterium pseudoresistens]
MSAESDDATGSSLDQAVARVEHELGRLFARIRIGWREAAATVHPELQPLGYQVLTSIVSGKATTAGEIIERLQTDKSAISRHVRQLEQLGLIESVRDPDDRRMRRLVATPLAQERVAEARAAYEGRLGDRLRSWSVEDLDHFLALLDDFGR